MENKDLPAFPFVESATPGESVSLGLTKREYIATMCLQGLLANSDYNCPSRPKNMVTTGNTIIVALNYADCLLKELEK